MVHMTITLDGEEYYTINEACDYLGGITSQTLRTRTKALGIPRYQQQIAPNIVYYKRKDLESMRAMRPIKENDDHKTYETKEGS
jgi:hypothetical protein